MSVPTRYSSLPPQIGDYIAAHLGDRQIRLIRPESDSSTSSSIDMVYVGRRLGSGDVTIVYELDLGSTTAATLEINPEKYILKLPRYDKDSRDKYPDNCEAVEKERQYIIQLNNAQNSYSSHVPSALKNIKAIGLTFNGQEYFFPALITSFAPGIQIDDLVAGQGSLDEPTALAIGLQLAGVVAMAHGCNLECTDLKLDRLIWDATKSSLQVIDWNVTRDLLGYDNAVVLVARQADTRRVAELIAEMMLGIPLSEGQRASERQEFSKHLGVVLDQAISQPELMGEHPADTLANQLSAIRATWEYSARQLYDELSNTIEHLQQARDSGSKNIDRFYYQIDIGRRLQGISAEQWDRLEADLNRLWDRELKLKREEIAQGNFSSEVSASLEQLRYYPERVHLPILWRKRLLRLILNSESASQLGKELVALLDQWDLGNYPMPPDKLKRSLPEYYELLSTELTIAYYKQRYDTASLEDRIECAEALQNLRLPAGIDERLAHWREEIVRESKVLQTRQAIEQQQTEIHQKLNELRDQVASGYASGAELFDSLLAPATPQQRAMILALRALAQALERGDVSTALAQYKKLQGTLGDTDTQVERRIAALAVGKLGLQNSAVTFGQAFDCIAAHSANDERTLAAQVQLLEALYPLDKTPDRQERLSELQDRERSVFETIYALLSANDLQTRLAALSKLQADGINRFGNNLTIDFFEPGNLYAQYQNIRNELQQLLERFPDTDNRPTVEGIGDRVQAIDRRLVEDQALGDQEHSDLWNIAIRTARPFFDLADQHQTIAARRLMNEFRQLPGITNQLHKWNIEQSGTALSLARQIGYFRVALTRPAGSDQENTFSNTPSPTMMETATLLDRFTHEYRTIIDRSIYELLNFDDTQDPYTQAQALLQARRLLQVYDALGGMRDERPTNNDLAKVAKWFRFRSVEERRNGLGLLPIDTDPKTLADQLGSIKPPKKQSFPLARIGAIALAGIAILVILAFVVNIWNTRRRTDVAPAETTATITAGATSVSTAGAPDATAQPAAPLLRIAAPIPDRVELAPGGQTEIVIPVVDANNLATSAELVVNEAPAVKVLGEPAVQLNEGRGVFYLTLRANEDAQAGEQLITFALKDSPDDTVQVVVTIGAAAPAGGVTEKIKARLDTLLTITSTANVNLRKEPDENSDGLDQLPTGTSLLIVQLPPKGNYIKVFVNEKEGWVYSPSTTYNDTNRPFTEYPLLLQPTAPGEPISIAPNPGDPADQLMPDRIELLDLLPVDQQGAIWIKVRVTTNGADAQSAQTKEGWVLATQTTYDQVINELATQLHIQ